jgi:hypothetical protein
MATRTSPIEQKGLRPRLRPAGIAPPASRAGDVAFGALAAVLAFLVAAVVLRVEDLSLEVPMQYGFETLYYLMVVKGIADHGSYNENESLGAPLGQELYDLVLGTEQLNLALVDLIALMFPDPGEIVNLFYLLSFPLVALSAYLAMRLLAVSPPVATVCAVLYALLPFHFVRGPGHLFLAAYYAVPLGAYLVLAAATGAQLFAKRGSERRQIRRWASGRSLLTVAFCVVIGSAGVYWAAFTLFLLVAAGGLRLASTRRLGSVTAGAVVAALIALTVVVNVTPSLVYDARHGANPGATQRPPNQTELYGLKLADLVLPIEGHRVESFGELTGRYRAATPLGSERGQTLGLVGTFGFVFLLAIAFVRLAGRRAPVEPELTHAASAATLVAFVLGTVGGGALIFAHLVTPQLRAWNRISVFIAFFALLTVAFLLDRLGRTLGSGVPARALFAGALLLVAAVGVYDQTTERYAPSEKEAVNFQQDRDFVRAIEAVLPKDAAVFQLPNHRFPEGGQIVDMTEYDLLRGYVHSEDLRWSFGAVKGRPEDWAEALVGRPLATVVPSVAAVGFEGIFIDRAGYTDRGAQLEGELGPLLGVKPIVSADGRHSFFDLRPYEARLRRAHRPDTLGAFAAATLKPLSVHPGPELGDEETDADRSWRWALAERAGLLVHNPADEPRTARLRTTVERLWYQPASVRMTLPNGRSRAFRAGAGMAAARIEETVRVPPGDSTIWFETDGQPARVAGDPRELYFRLVDLTFTDERQRPFVGELPL